LWLVAREAFGIKKGRLKISRRSMRVVAKRACQLLATGDIAAALQHSRAMTCDAEHFRLAGDQEIVPHVQQPLSGLVGEWRRLSAMHCNVPLQVTLQAEVVDAISGQAAWMDKLRRWWLFTVR
jgi:hypothetical protein